MAIAARARAERIANLREAMKEAEQDGDGGGAGFYVAVLLLLSDLS